MYDQGQTPDVMMSVSEVLLELQWDYSGSMNLCVLGTVSQTHWQTGMVLLFADTNELTFTLHHQQNLMLKHRGFREKCR